MTDQTRASYDQVLNGIGRYHLPPSSSGERNERPDRTRWRVVYQDTQGRQRSRGGFFTKAEARHWQAHNTTALDRNEYVDKRAGAETFQTYAEEWLRIRTNDLRPKTVDLYRYLLNNLLFPTFGSVQLRRISRTDVKRWLADLPQSHSTKAKAYRLLRQILQEAELDRRIVQNPLHHPIPNAATERPTRRYEEPPTIAEVRNLANAVPKKYRAMVLLAGFCGLREAELFALERRHVSLLNGTVKVEQQVVEIRGSQAIVPHTKTDAGQRTVRIPEEIAAELERLMRESETALLFPARKRGGHQRPLRRSNWNRVWRAARERTGLDFHFHDLRHTAGTLAARTGLPEKERMRFMGHKSRAASVIYEHATQTGQDELAAAMDILIAAEASSPAATGTSNVVPIRRT